MTTPSAVLDTDTPPAAGERHSTPTRWSHIGLASAVIIQVATSLVMKEPHPDRAGNVFFTIHEISGLTALFFAFCFWCTIAARRRGTPVALLFPWFSPKRIAAVFSDALNQLGQIFRLRLPHYEDESPLASAIHGLGLLLMSAMAVTGTIWFASHMLDWPRSTLMRADMIAHHLLANLVWAYLIGHAFVALVHHVAGQASLAKMWSIKPAAD